MIMKGLRQSMALAHPARISANRRYVISPSKRSNVSIISTSIRLHFHFGLCVLEHIFAFAHDTHLIMQPMYARTSQSFVKLESNNISLQNGSDLLDSIKAWRVSSLLVHFLR